MAKDDPNSYKTRKIMFNIFPVFQTWHYCFIWFWHYVITGLNGPDIFIESFNLCDCSEGNIAETTGLNESYPVGVDDWAFRLWSNKIILYCNVIVKNLHCNFEIFFCNAMVGSVVKSEYYFLWILVFAILKNSLWRCEIFTILAGFEIMQSFSQFM